LIYPKCFTGVYPIYITSDSFVQPCCTVDSVARDVEPVFYKHSLYNKSFQEIIESAEWNDWIDGLYETTMPACTRMCSKKTPPRNSAAAQYSETSWDGQKRSGEVTDVQLETSNRCTLACLYCARLKTNNLNKNDLPLEHIQDILKYRYLKSLHDCGNYGDPIFYKHYH